MDAKEQNQIKKIEEEKSFEGDYVEIPPGDIVAFNELRSCADLVRMYQTNQLEIQPDFQREIVWDRADQTRFIDSLIKQLPIPSMCISLDYKTNKRQVIDGLQRMSSIIHFLEDQEWKLSSLSDIEPKISGKTNLVIKEKLNDYYERVENLTIPVTILRCDYSKQSHANYLFTIFHRLNSGGSKLNNQEIRNCIYNGSFNSQLKGLTKYEHFVKLMGIKKGRAYRFGFEELLLRFFAFYDRHKKYNGRLAKFLNDYMFEHKEIDDNAIAKRRNLFNRTIDLLVNNLSDGVDVKTLSKALIEGLLVGVAKNIDYLEQLEPEGLVRLYDAFRSSEEYSFENLKSDLSARDKVIDRIDFSIRNFAGQ